MKRYILAAAWILAAFSISAAEPSDYYTSCKGKSGASLLKALEGVIGNHTNVGYNGLWTLYKTADVDANGKIWDIYSTKRWTPGSEQCGNYSKVGDCYNREHSLPKSWFNDQSPMYSDAFHIYPTDGKVNGQRSNYPYGECAGGSSVAANGSVKPLGKLGDCTYPGYSGKVFEPDDEYKGDLARSYFYMAACYNSRISSWDSDMLAGNAFPAFTSWATSLLMKWHREDPVSPKEQARNEAVYAAQRNRNPFIDHPELAEHIWGDKSTTGWSGSSDPAPAPAFTSPAAGARLDMGAVTVGKARSYTVSVRGTNMTAATSVSISGTGFSVSPASLTAEQVNAGTSVTVTLTAKAAGSCTATLKLTSGSASVTATIAATAEAGLTASPATDITTSGFTARWVNGASNASATYQLHLADAAGKELSGYPKTVKAADESLKIDGLETATTYTYWLTDGSEKSNVITVTTHSELPEIFLEPGSDLVFATTPGVPSDAVTIFIDAYNVEGDITVEVTAPFEISLDKTAWAAKLTLGEDDGQIYLRLNGDVPGVFRTAVRAVAEGAFNDDLMAEGVIEAAEPLCESFEVDADFGYSGIDRQEDIARWNFSGAGVFSDPRDVRTGRQGVRFNTSENGSVTMAEPMAGGVSEVTFYVRRWDSAAVSAELQYSLDGGASWTAAASVSPGAEWTAATARIEQPGAVMLRVVKTDGARMALDDIEITPMQASVDLPDAEQLWNVMAAGGIVTVSNPGSERPLAIYQLDGTCAWRGEMPAGTIALALPAGHYIAVSGQESRRFVVR